jgi:hypothetical protein
VFTVGSADCSATEIVLRLRPAVSRTTAYRGNDM